MSQFTGFELDGYKIVRRLRLRAVARRMILDAQLKRIRDHTQIAIVLIIVILEHQLISFAVPFLDELRGAERGTVSSFAQARQRMASVAANHIRDLAAVGPGSSEALIVVRVPGEKRMRPYADFLANLVNLRDHVDTPAVRGSRGVRWMVGSEQQRSVVLLPFDPLQRGLDKIQLRIADLVIGNYSGVLQSIGVQHDYAYKGRLECEEYTGLNLRRS